MPINVTMDIKQLVLGTSVFRLYQDGMLILSRNSVGTLVNSNTENVIT